jgi:tRNA(Ile)-lysidine synthase
VCKKMEQYTQIPPLAQIVREHVAAQPGVARVLLALSGGLDSTALLHATVAAQLPQPLLAVHVNHGLSPNASEWQRHCEALCHSLGVAMVSEAVTVAREGEGLEQAARAARYQAIEKHLRLGDLVLMAHHQMDQVETFFLRLARGAGTSGLAAMAQVRDWGPARLGRPFLGLSRDHLHAYAQHHGLRWIEDESNADEGFDRNYLRAQILPLMQQRWPALPAQVVRAAELCRESDQLLADYAAQDLQTCQPRRERVGVSLLAAPLLEWSTPRRHWVMRHWLLSLDFRSPAQKQLAQLQSLLTAARDQNPLLDWGDCELRRFGDRVYCLPTGWNSLLSGSVTTDLTADMSVDLQDGFQLQTSIGQPGLAPGHYTLLPRSACPPIKRGHPFQRHHSQTLKNLLQEFRLEPWLRDRVPLVMVGDQLVGVADLWVERDFIRCDSESLQLTWRWSGARRFD